MFARAYRKALITVGGNATLLRFLAFLWKMIPFRARREVTFLFIKTVLWEKQMLKTDDQTEIAAIKDLGSLAYWGFPKVDINTLFPDRWRLSRPYSVPFLARLKGLAPGQPAGANGLRRGDRNNTVMTSVSVPRKYGYQWAKWVNRLEVVTDDRKGYWGELGLSDWGDVGDVW